MSTTRRSTILGTRFSLQSSLLSSSSLGAFQFFSTPSGFYAKLLDSGGNAISMRRSPLRRIPLLQLTITRRLTTTTRPSTLGRSCDAHRSLPLHQVLQLLAGLVTRTTNTSRVSTLGRRRDAHRSLPLHQDVQFVTGFVTPSAAYQYINVFKSWGASTAAYHYIKILNSWEAS